MIYLIDPRNTTKPYNYELLLALKEIGVRYKFIGIMPNGIENPPIPSCNSFLPLSRGLFGNWPRGARFVANVSQTPEILAGWMNLKLGKRDIIHMLWITSPSVESIIIPALRGKVRKLIHTAHNILPHRERKSDYSLFKKLYPAFDNIIVHSSYTKKDFLHLFPEVNEEKITVLPVGNYENFYNTHDRTTQDEVKKISSRSFLFMGPIKPYKGFNILWEAVQLLKNQNFKILVKANWAPKESHFIKYSTPLPYQRLGLLYRASDVVILPYTKTSLATPLLEAAYFAKPVIVSKIGALQEIVRDGKEGFLTEPGSPESLKLAIEKALTLSERELKLMGKSLKQRSISRFSWKLVAERLAIMYAP